jgi:hypothetical protein
MAMEKVAQEHNVTEDEEAIVRNWQSDGVSSDGSYHNPKDEFGHLLHKRGLKKVQMTVIPIIFLSSKRYDNP